MYAHRSLALAVALSVALPGCFQTHYTNLPPPAAERSVDTSEVSPRARPSGWQSFFIWGWVPSEKIIRADQQCGGVGRVREIRTQRTFLEGLVAAVAGYYVNIYSPYDAEIFCEGDIERP